MENNSEQKNFLNLIKELLEVQTTLAKIDAQIAVRKGQEQIKDIIDNTKKI